MKYYFSLIIWLFSLKINAQQVYFNKTYSLNFAVTNTTGIVQKGDYYYAAGVGYANWETNQKAIIYKLNSSGQQIDYGTGTNETAWIVKLDSMGCDTPGYETVSIARALRQFSSL